MLRFAEEVMLLLLDDDEERFIRVPDWSLRYALGGAVLMDLALEDRIDTDMEKLILVDPTPMDDAILDPLLTDIAAHEHQRDARFWVERASGMSDDIRESAIDRLIERGILERREDRFLWVFRSRRYPVIDGKAEREVKLRLMEVLFSDIVPTPRDVVMIGLADACGIFAELLSKRELRAVLPRIELIRKMDLIGRAVTAAVWDIEVSLAQAIRPHMA
ncbi:MAG: GPP34 family phosphoprotein [Gemmatimonadetes bacterium]|nr:GPP34 family phosphoprotein [Gemmatimonadota bacterium]MCY3611772.1 GPP34 family phosphoprotein [Gemmatimonadota bacterium]MCY3677107.1 GPP34 family phosphoprotein [Gemmatimonadota bacterium]MYA42100.1 GPP34 family phosphoprotein [Gemmatimonadota bacterium]MYE91863.1 GPP34 family phosphoprotein [Gemmatimonadota bacterium]